MRLVSFRRGGAAGYGAVKEDGVVALGERLGARAPDVRTLLANDLVDEARRIVQSSPPDFALAEAELLAPVTNPGKILCVGINYISAAEEAGREPPKYPSLFFRTPAAQVGHEQPIVMPKVSDKLDLEGEMALVIGRRGRYIAPERALDFVAGYACFNDGTLRDWTRHGVYNVTAGKNFVASGAFGPWLVTADEIPDPGALAIETRVNGAVVQRDVTGRVHFPIARILEYISTFTELEPGDVISTGTPAGAGDKQTPPRMLKVGDVIEIEIERIGVLRNRVVAEA